MVNRNKAKGTSFETLVVTYMRDHFPHAQRSHTSPTGDAGDVTGIVGLVVQCKNQSRDLLGMWVDAMLRQRAHAGVDFGVVVHKRQGKALAEHQYVTMPLGDFCRLYANYVWMQGLIDALRELQPQPEQ